VFWRAGRGVLDLQVVQHAKYEAWADRNYLRTIPLRAPRGVVFDRNGRTIVETAIRTRSFCCANARRI
jgi:cell division protein FtsI/penicillin-binding protein 2